MIEITTIAFWYHKHNPMLERAPHTCRMSNSSSSDRAANADLGILVAMAKRSMRAPSAAAAISEVGMNVALISRQRRLVNMNIHQHRMGIS